jgi:recombination protein RecT
VNESERFVTYVVKEFGKDVNERTQGLVHGYFVGISRALQVAEENRIQKNKNNTDHKWDNNVPVVWGNVSLPDLAKDIVINAKLGLDMTIPNHLSPIPFFNYKTQKYCVSLMKGYVGCQIMAEKYAIHKPKAVTVELVYSKDYFVPVKKSRENPVECYDFEIKEPFDRGTLRGGFGYIEFDDPARNKLVIMTMADIMKRKPEHASVEFWGGVKTKKVWNKEKKAYEEEEVQVEGWLEEMCTKTIKREVYSPKYLPLDPAKIDDNYQAAIARDLHYAELDAEREIEENANTVTVAPTPELPPPTDPQGGDPF